LANDASFSAFARLTVEHARQRFGAREVQAVQNGWAQVGVDLTEEH
jgi:Zn-dependent metalloprotease